MKTGLMAAAAACWRKARASGRACLESKGNPHRLFRAAAAIALAIAIVPATVLLGGAAFADRGEAGSGYTGSWHLYKACAPRYRISHKDTGCMHAWWDNTPPWSSGVAGGSTWGAQNKCADYGAMKANIDLVNGVDQHFHMSNGDKKRGNDGVFNIRDIACCLDKSDLCWKWSVEPQDGKIKVWTGSNANYQWVDVSTHSERYKFCADKSDHVYCNDDPEGDAFTVPEVRCDGSRCNARDCMSKYHDLDSAASNACAMSNVRYSDGICTFDTTCDISLLGKPGVVGYDEDFDIFIHDMDEIRLCANDDPYLMGPYDRKICGN